jgi:Glycosyl transferase family 2
MTHGLQAVPYRDPVPETATAITVVIPARDEAHAIGDVIAGVREHLPAARVIVVDDASRDGTAVMADRMGAEIVRLPVHTGYRAALADDLDVLVQMDGDGQHRPADIPALISGLDDADLVLGSRFLSGTPGYTIPRGRRVGMAACRWMAAAVGGLHLSDPTSGFRALAPHVAAGLAAEGFPSGLTETSLLIHLHRAGVRLREVPVHMLPPTGRSMHAGLAGGAHFVRISWAVLGQARRGREASPMVPGGPEAASAATNAL